MTKTRKAKASRADAGYRVVYGETMPAWEQEFPTRREAEAFAKKRRGVGDIVFDVRKVVPGDESLRGILTRLGAAATRR